MGSSSRTIRVEFFGIPRARSGVAETTLDFLSDTSTFGEVLTALAERFPEFAKQCVVARGLADGFAANVGGERFLHSRDDVLSAGDTLLIFSADAGG